MDTNELGQSWLDAGISEPLPESGRPEPADRLSTHKWAEAGLMPWGEVDMEEGKAEHHTPTHTPSTHSHPPTLAHRQSLHIHTDSTYAAPPTHTHVHMLTYSHSNSTDTLSFFNLVMPAYSTSLTVQGIKACLGEGTQIFQFLSLKSSRTLDSRVGSPGAIHAQDGERQRAQWESWFPR